jgi:hypothetical protein
MLRLKRNARATGVRPELLLAIKVAEEKYAHHGHVLVITSLLDGVHSSTSLHYAGCAADLRTTAGNIPEEHRRCHCHEYSEGAYRRLRRDRRA